MVISDAEKALDKIHHSLITKTLSKPGVEGNFLNLIKGSYSKLIANVMLNGKRLTAFPVRSETRQ